MRFQTKMIITYTVFTLLVGAVIATLYYNYGIKQYRKTEEENLSMAAKQVVNQVDGLIAPMETRTRYILSDPEILESIRLLAAPQSSEAYENYAYTARATIRSGLAQDYVVYDFHRVLFFNQVGSVVSSRTRPPLAGGVVDDAKNSGDMPWLEAVDAANGKSVLIGAHEDNWGVHSQPQVISLIRAIQGKGMGYIEVQRTVSSVGQAIILPQKYAEVAIFLNDGPLVYASPAIENLENYWALLPQSGVLMSSSEGYGTALVAVEHSEKYNITVMVMESNPDLRAASNSVAPITVLIAFVFYTISIIYVVAASRLLSKPLRQLRDVMERTHLDNLDCEINVSMPNNELEALNLSYQNVLERLRESIMKEHQLSLLHAQAQFDMLQAQVNPHFLYNVLNVISQRGMVNGDEGICDLCAGLATMLRYSTNIKRRYAPISQELEYLRQYFHLMESRYKQKISFKVDVESALQAQLIPRIALQQLVENSINHGFVNITELMEVEIIGRRYEDRWVIQVCDNGQGIMPDRLEEINAKLEETKRRIMRKGSGVELEIGGMGLVNTYARLYLYYGETFEFELSNRKWHGTQVCISAPWDEEIRDVSSYGGG